MEGFFLVLTGSGPKDFKGRRESALRCGMVPARRSTPCIFSAGVDARLPLLTDSGLRAHPCLQVSGYSREVTIIQSGVFLPSRGGEWQPHPSGEMGRLA